MQQIDAFKLSIAKWEGLYQHDPADLGNTRLAGTMRGVTPAAWAQFTGKPITEITADVMKAITLDDAAKVYDANYYRTPGFNKFVWGAPIDVASDIGWGSGPVRAIKALQSLSGAHPDGKIGDKTTSAYKSWLAEIGDGGAVDALHSWRCEWYKQICVVRPTNQKFLKGWLNRANWQSTKSPWWQHWQKVEAPKPEPTPTPNERQAIAEIPEWELDKIMEAAKFVVFNMYPGLAQTYALLRRLFS